MVLAGDAYSSRTQLNSLIAQIKEYFIGHEDLVTLLAVALLSEGHILIEGPPGTGKTLLAKVFALSIGGKFSRIQMTPDLLPADIIGTVYYDLQRATWKTRLGPIFANVVMVDELNRASPRTQSALLEAMQERQVTIEGTTYPLPRPFLVIATRIPVVDEGTYKLPTEELDRFSYTASIPGFNLEVEREVLEKIDKIEELDVKNVLSPEDIDKMVRETRNIYVSPKIKDYILSLVSYTRNAEEVDSKPSTRATIWLMKGARALAYLKGRFYVLPDDVKWLAPFVLRHRLALKPEYQLDGLATEDIIKRALSEVEVPKA
ncbi:MAG: MoxR family ATPase [Thermofilum sp.]|uniref:AAA family ATPase n=1 Tax=Thermofilum sp. TaxID=1961369 RepID=UPI0025869A27|nr:MoxR family ATPase [Thermofilum sp.]MCI4407777.1 MoxR family ATPase [Thermofilum sp.]